MTTMTFGDTLLKYRIVLNTHTQVFMAFDLEDENKIGYGITIEQAIADLQKNA